MDFPNFPPIDCQIIEKEGAWDYAQGILGAKYQEIKGRSMHFIDNPSYRSYTNIPELYRVYFQQFVDQYMELNKKLTSYSRFLAKIQVQLFLCEMIPPIFSVTPEDFKVDMPDINLDASLGQDLAMAMVLNIENPLEMAVDLLPIFFKGLDAFFDTTEYVPVANRLREAHHRVEWLLNSNEPKISYVIRNAYNAKVITNLLSKGQSNDFSRGNINALFHNTVETSEEFIELKKILCIIYDPFSDAANEDEFLSNAKNHANTILAKIEEKKLIPFLRLLFAFKQITYTNSN